MDDSKSKTISGETIRIQVGLLDNLMNYIGELVLIRNQFIQITNRSNSRNETILNLGQNLNVVTNELQNDVMKTRMQPIGRIFSKVDHIVSDLSQELGKLIDVKIEGSETELDKTLVEAIKDPLIHIIRNAVDHGIEMPAEREKKGKSPKGKVDLKAFHEGGQVIVQITDDGKGLDENMIKEKAIQKGLVTEEQMSKMTKPQIFNLIFSPGFSTAKKVSNISGRGVGMDVVKTNIEQIGGSIELNSELGYGSVIMLKIPLTLAIVPALIVKSYDEKFAIPQVKLEELVRIDHEDIETDNNFNWLHGKPIYNLRGKVLPLLFLNEILDLSDKSERKSDLNIAVLSANNHSFGLIVDEIIDSTDIVVKPLNSFLKKIPVYSGATIMGDGSVALTLDVIGIAEKEKISSNENLLQADSGLSASTTTHDIYNSEEYLLVDLEVPGKFAIPLGLVNRLENFDMSDIEYSGEYKLLNYRDDIMPIISVAEHLGHHPSTKKAMDTNIKIVVIKYKDRFYGIEVKAIADILNINGIVDEKSRNKAIFGTINHENEIIMCIDVYNLISSMTEFSDSKDANGSSLHGELSQLKVVLVDDSQFYRNYILNALNDLGIQTVVAHDGAEVVEMIKNDSKLTFDLLISDIEMPKMNGFDLITFIRGHEKHRNVKAIAMSTKYSDSWVSKGKNAGFNEYLKKFKEQELIDTIKKIFNFDHKKAA